MVLSCAKWFVGALQDKIKNVNDEADDFEGEDCSKIFMRSKIVNKAFERSEHHEDQNNNDIRKDNCMSKMLWKLNCLN